MPQDHAIAPRDRPQQCPYAVEGLLHPASGGVCYGKVTAKLLFLRRAVTTLAGVTRTPKIRRERAFHFRNLRWRAARVFACIASIASHLTAPLFAQLSIERVINSPQAIPDYGSYVSSFVWSNTGIVDITDVNVRLALSGASGTTMRLGQMYATLTHGTSLEDERVAVLLNRPGVNNANAFGSSLRSLDVWFDDSVNAPNVFSITNSSGTYQSDGRIGVNPYGPRVAYSTNQITAGLSALNGSWLGSSTWSLLVADAQRGNRAQLDSWALRVIGTAASNGIVDPGAGGVVSVVGAGTQTLGATVDSTGSGASAVNLSPGAGAKLTLSAGLAGVGDFRKQGEGILRLEGVSSNFTGKVVVDAGEVQLASSSALGTSGRLEIAGSNALVRLVNSVVISNAMVLSDGATARLDGAGRLAGGISGGGGLLKEGVSTVTIEGLNTFTGATAVTAGKLVVNGDISASAVTVQSNAVLGGSGAVGSATILSGATIAPGNSPGTLTNTGDLTWSGGGFYDWEIFNVAGVAGATNTWDLIRVTDQLLFSSISSSNTFSINIFSLSGLPSTLGPLSGWNPANNYSWTILSTTNGIVGFDPGYFTLNLGNFTNNNTLGGGLFSLAMQGNDLNLMFTATTVPEPGTWAAAALLAGVAGFVRWRRRGADNGTKISPGTVCIGADSHVGFGSDPAAQSRGPDPSA